MNYSYISLLQAIELFSSSHLQVKRFVSDFPSETPNLVTDDEAFPVLLVSPSNSIFDANITTFTIDVYCYDIIQKDRSNLNSILSDTNLILNDLKLWLTDGDLEGIDVIESVAATPINNALLDYAAGWVASFKVEMNNYSVCDIPFNGAPIVSGICNNVTYGVALTCETLVECPVIQDIQNDILALQTGTTGTDYYTTGATLVDNIAYFNRNDTLSAYTLDLSTFSGGIEMITGGENLLIGDLAYLSNDGKYYKADNSNETTSSTELRIALENISINTEGNSLIRGEFTTSGLTAGDKYYVGTNGDYTNVLPTIDGSIIRYIGTALSTTKLEFNPDQTYFEIGEETIVQDTYVTGGTYNAGTAVFTNNTGGTFSVTGFSTGGGTFSGGTVTGPTIFTNGLTASTITKSGGTVNDILLANGTTKKVGELRRFINNQGSGTGYTASGSLQKIFNIPSTDVSFDVISGRSYTYKLHMSVSSMPATTSPVFFGFMGTSDGNFSVVSNAYRIGTASPNTAWAHTYYYNCSFGNNYNVYTASNTTSQLFITIEGVFDCGVTGNLYPCIGSTLFSSTTLLKPNSWFEIIELTNNQTNTNN